MLKYLFLFVLSFQFLHAAIYDCFTYFNEEDILQVRLEELNDYVDYFVLVEAKDTFTGKDKPLYFGENKEKFHKFLPKIIHIVLEKSPGFSRPIDREHFQRNQIMRGLKKCKKRDIIMISDVDEIPRGKDLHLMISSLNINHPPRIFRILPKFLRKKVRPVIGCGCDFYRWFFNRRVPLQGPKDRGWIGTALTNYKYLLKKNPQMIRDLREKYHIIPKAGWHFSNMGGYDMYMQKIVSFADDKANAHRVGLPPEEIYKLPKSQVLVSKEEIEETFPKYVLDHYREFDKKNYFDKGFYK